MLVFDTASHGKPFLAGPESVPRFNVSHAGTIALLAFARAAEVGVDIKCLGAGLGVPAPDARDVWVTDLEVAPEAVAALAATGGPRRIRRREYAVAAQSR